jgi:hypothetical protein
MFFLGEIKSMKNKNVRREFTCFQPSEIHDFFKRSEIFVVHLMLGIQVA